MQFLAGLRMGLAREIMMTEQSVTIAELSARIGYNSEASFSRAFKRAHGSHPAKRDVLYQTSCQGRRTGRMHRSLP